MDMEASDDSEGLPLPSADIDASKIRQNFRRDEGARLSRAARVQVLCTLYVYCCLPIVVLSIH
jgi:hypothetical protein